MSPKWEQGFHRSLYTGVTLHQGEDKVTGSPSQHEAKAFAAGWGQEGSQSGTRTGRERE